MNFKNFTIVGLVVMNLALLGYMFFGKQSHRPPPGGHQGHRMHPMKEGKLFKHFKKELDLTDEQVTNMKTLRKANRDLAEGNIQKIEELKNQFRELAIAPTFDTTTLNNLVKEIADLTFEIDKEVVVYIRATRDLLSDEQKAKFDNQFYRFIPKDTRKKKGKH